MRSSITPSPGRRLLIRSSTLLVLSYVCFFVLQQSHTLWSRAVLLPGSEEGPFGAFRRLFHPGWLYASRTLEIGLANALVYVLLLAWLFGSYLFTIKKAFQPDMFNDGGGRGALRLILTTTALALLVLVLLPGTFSTDMHSYIWYGRIFAIYGDNPFIHTPSEYATRDVDGWLDSVYWKEVLSVYGPVWVWLAGGIAVTAEWLGGGIGTHLIGHRLLAACAHLGNCLLVWRVAALMLERYGHILHRHSASGYMPVDWRRGRQIAATLVYAWNPLALIEFGANGHNDVLLLTGLLACLWLHLVGRWRLAVVALALATLVKVVALIWLPGYLWLLFWDSPGRAPATRSGRLKRLGRVAEALALILLIWVVAYLPFWQGPATLQPLVGGPAATRMINSLGQLLYLKLPEGMQHLREAIGLPLMHQAEAAEFTDGLVTAIRWGGLLITAVIAAAVIWRARTFPKMLHAWGWATFGYLTVGAVWYWPWYASWLLVPVALVGMSLGWGWRLLVATQILCATGLVLYAIYPDVPEYLKDLPAWRALIVIGPAVTYVTCCLATLISHKIWHKSLLIEGIGDIATQSGLAAKLQR